MEGDLVFCFVAFGLHLGSWLLAVAIVGMTILRERERERERDGEVLLVWLHLRSGCYFFE